MRMIMINLASLTLLIKIVKYKLIKTYKYKTAIVKLILPINNNKQNKITINLNLKIN